MDGSNNRNSARFDDIVGPALPVSTAVIYCPHLEQATVGHEGEEIAEQEEQEGYSGVDTRTGHVWLAVRADGSSSAHQAAATGADASPPPIGNMRI